MAVTSLPWGGASRRTSWTRRFSARPTGVSFVATGWLWPTPSASIRPEATPRAINAAFTASARSCDNCLLRAASPVESVWPMICSRQVGNVSMVSAMSLSSDSVCGWIVALSRSKWMPYKS